MKPFQTKLSPFIESKIDFFLELYGIQLRFFQFYIQSLHLLSPLFLFQRKCPARETNIQKALSKYDCEKPRGRGIYASNGYYHRGLFHGDVEVKWTNEENQFTKTFQRTYTKGLINHWSPGEFCETPMPIFDTLYNN